MPIQCMYLNTVFKLFKGELRDISLVLPQPIHLTAENVEIRERVIKGANGSDYLDNRLMIWPFTHELQIEEIVKISERVGGMLNGVLIEIAIRKITIVDSNIHIPFYTLDGVYPIGVEKVCSLKIEII